MASFVNVISGGPDHLGVGYPSGWTSHPHRNQLSACRLTLLRTLVLCRSFNVAKPRATFMLPKTSGCPRALPDGAGASEAPDHVGLSLGRMASSLPTTDEIINIYKENKIPNMCISPTDEDVIPLLKAIQEDKIVASNLKVVLCIDINELAALSDRNSAQEWVNNYVTNNEGIISHVCVGSVSGIDGFSLVNFIKAMTNIKGFLRSRRIGLSAIVTDSILGPDYQADTQPSTCKLIDADNSSRLVTALKELNGDPIPLFVRVMPYFNFKITSGSKLENYLLNDGAHDYLDDGGVHYNQVYDAMIDSIFAAMEDAKHKNVEMYVLTGWPTKGVLAEASFSNAKTFNKNLASRVSKFTPKKNRPVATFIYTLANEDKYAKTQDEAFKNLGTFLPWKRSTFP